MCRDCERRVRPDAAPMCAACWEVRARTVGPAAIEKPSTALQTAALVLGIIALVPIPGVQVAALVVSLAGLFRVRSEPARRVRWRAVVGLLLTLAGFGVDYLVFFVLPRGL